jgi:hypothetical protein
LRSAVDSLDSALAFGVLGGLLSVLVHGFVDVPFRPQPGTLFWLLLALLGASIRMRRRSGGEGLEPSEARAGDNGRAG